MRIKQFYSAGLWYLPVAWLGTHVALTFFENTPDAKTSFANRSRTLSRLPQWRFFAPNPGVDNTHLMCRTYVDDAWSPWQQLPISSSVRWYSLVWNPGNRAPKVLFDSVQQLRVLGSMGVHLDLVSRNDAYLLLEDIVHQQFVGEPGVDATQFMIMTSRPEVEGVSHIEPIMVSQERRSHRTNALAQ
jgi:hypothetical protein